MTASQTIHVTQTTVSCAGDPKIGHPKVYLHLGITKESVCPYCSRRFVLKKNLS